MLLNNILGVDSTMGLAVGSLSRVARKFSRIFGSFSLGSFSSIGLLSVGSCDEILIVIGHYKQIFLRVFK